MIANRQVSPADPPGLKRVFSLGSLSEADKELFRRAAAAGRTLPPGRQIMEEGASVGQPRIILSGWAYRARHFSDGRMQILGLLLPGEFIGLCRHRNPLAATSVLAVTPVAAAPLPKAADLSNSDEVYALSSALEEFCLFRQIARLGRLSAYERTIDWLLETRERLMPAGLVERGWFPMPLTQMLIADLLGLTTVHLNRTLGALRREKMLDFRKGRVCLHDPALLSRIVDYRTAPIGSAPSADPSDCQSPASAWGTGSHR